MKTVTLKLQNGFTTENIFDDIIEADQNSSEERALLKTKKNVLMYVGSDLFNLNEIKSSDVKKSYVAITVVNTSSKFGKDLTFLNTSPAEGLYRDFNATQVNDILEVRKDCEVSSKRAVRCSAKFLILSKTESEVVLEVI